MGVVQGETVYIHRKKTISPRMYVTVSKKTHIHSQKHGKMRNGRANSPLNLSCNRMYVHSREREHDDIIVLIDEDPISIVTLKQCRLWNFYECAHMRAQPRLLNALVDY
jgi:hypothetical protein